MRRETRTSVHAGLSMKHRTVYNCASVHHTEYIVLPHMDNVKQKSGEIGMFCINNSKRNTINWIYPESDNKIAPRLSRRAISCSISLQGNIDLSIALGEGTTHIAGLLIIKISSSCNALSGNQVQQLQLGGGIHFFHSVYLLLLLVMGTPDVTPASGNTFAPTI